MFEGPQIPRPSAERERKERRRAAAFEWMLLAGLLFLVATIAPIFLRVANRVFA